MARRTLRGAAIIRAPPRHTSRMQIAIEFAPLDRLRTRLQVRRRSLPGHRRAHGGDGSAARLRLAARTQAAADAPGAGHPRVGIRRRDSDSPRRALPAVEGLGVLLDLRPRAHRFDIHRQAILARAAARQAPCPKAASVCRRAPGATTRCSWARSTLCFGLANIWVALNRSEADWVTFKVWILTPVAIVFTFGLLLWTACAESCLEKNSRA